MQVFPYYIGSAQYCVASCYELPLVLFSLMLKVKLHCLMPEKLMKSEKGALSKIELKSAWAFTK